MLDGTQFKPYMLAFYQVYTLTCLYLAGLFDSVLALNRARTFLEYILKMVRISKSSKGGTSAKERRSLRKTKINFQKLRLMEARLRINLGLQTAGLQGEKDEGMS